MSLFGNKPPPRPSASAVATLFEGSEAAATGGGGPCKAETDKPAQPAKPDRSSLFGGSARSVMASIFDDDDAKPSATSLLSRPSQAEPVGVPARPARPASPGPGPVMSGADPHVHDEDASLGAQSAPQAPHQAAEPRLSTATPAQQAHEEAATEVTPAQANLATSATSAEAGRDISVKSTAAGRLAALRQRISSGSSGSDSDAAWEPNPAKPASAQSAQPGLFGTSADRKEPNTGPPPQQRSSEKETTPAHTADPPTTSSGLFADSEVRYSPLVPASDTHVTEPPTHETEPTSTVSRLVKEEQEEQRAEPILATTSGPPPSSASHRASASESERPSLFGGASIGRTMNSIFDDDDDVFLKPVPSGKAMSGHSLIARHNSYETMR